MRPLLLLLAIALSPIAPAHGLESAPAANPRETATLVSETDNWQPGHTLRLGLRLRLAPGWHSYWSNPGDAGAPPTLDITGAAAGPIIYPAPLRQREGPFTSFAYIGEVLLPVTVTPQIAQGTLAIDAHAAFLACAKVCVPEDAKFHLDIPQGTGAPGPQAPLFADADARTPRKSPFPAHITPDGTLLLTAPGLAPQTAFFFPGTPGVIEHGAPQTLQIRGDTLSLHLKTLAAFNSHATLSGVLSLTDAGGQVSALQIDAPPGAAAAAGPSLSVLRALLLAFAGGLVLNLMPCVLPVLAMKAMALIRLSGGARHAIRREAGLYVLGVLVAFAAIGATTLAAREAGQAVGWGVQFQSAVFTTAMAWLLFAIGLNLSGVFEIGTSVAGAGEGLARRGGFFTGLLAVVVATPCTAPFMGAALAAAIAMPPASALAIFLSLGLGLAAPYGLLAIAPGLAAWLPRPGAWMDRLRQILAFPMYGAALWLLWVVSQQTGPYGLMLVLAGGLLLGFAAWAWGDAQLRDRARITRAVSLAALAGAGVLLAGLAMAPPATAVTAATDGAGPYSAARLAALRAEHRPVFVNMTAAWCITCLVNERVALSSGSVRNAFAQYHVAYLKGDWTRQDPAITAFLREHDRSGVPLYVYYPPDRDGEVLPQILTPAEILGRLPGAAST